jgi:hypothetical protein
MKGTADAGSADVLCGRAADAEAVCSPVGGSSSSVLLPTPIRLNEKEIMPRSPG